MSGEDDRQGLSARRRDLDRKAEVARAGARWRHLGAQGGYAGLRGEYAAYGAASLLDMIALRWDECPEPVRSEAVYVARVVLAGPDGGHDPRAARGRGLTEGDGF